MQTRHKLEIAIVAVATILLVTSGLWVYAAYQVWSEEKQFTADEGTILTVGDIEGVSVGQVVTFTGTLTDGGTPLSGETISLYIDDGTGYANTGLTDVTDASGNYSIDWVVPSVGTYSYKTLVTVS